MEIEKDIKEKDTKEKDINPESKNENNNNNLLSLKNKSPILKNLKIKIPESDRKEKKERKEENNECKFK